MYRETHLVEKIRPKIFNNYFSNVKSLIPIDMPFHLCFIYSICYFTVFMMN